MVYKTTFLITILITSTAILSSSSSNPPTPSPWPHQFHSRLIMNTNGSLQIANLWYDWINGRNFNIIQNQLANKVLYDLEWNNGTSYYYTRNLMDSDDDDESECKVLHFPVGILRPNWLEGAHYVGQKNIDGFLCNVWEKVDFITYFEDVLTKRPVHWIFFTGMTAHVMTFEIGAVLDDAEWQAPPNCFTKASKEEKIPLLESMVNDGSHSTLMRRFLNAF